MLITAPAMRNHTSRTVLDSLFSIPEIAAAFISKRIERAIAEQAVKLLFFPHRMAGIIFTFFVAEISGAVLSHK